eukprot:TRINITY_DN283_c7_g1_i1.p1 TRINITY_DN283_c7_g1~~TRINITY_DN283_c7_g1_i1.p1  ORF type:complete len:141 (+),score=20.50 TRINITY_DN283_c7_g1_i1:43-423(+)
MIFDILNTAVYYCGGVVAFLYPAICTFESLQKPTDEHADERWLAYWIVFSALYTVEFFFGWLLDFVLLGSYHWLRLFLLIYLSTGGAKMLYTVHIIPQIRQYLPPKKGGEGIKKFENQINDAIGGN